MSREVHAVVLRAAEGAVPSADSPGELFTTRVVDPDKSGLDYNGV